MTGEVNRLETSNRSESEAEEAVSTVRSKRTLVRLKSVGVDAKPSDLHMSRVKFR